MSLDVSYSYCVIKDSTDLNNVLSLRAGNFLLNETYKIMRRKLKRKHKVMTIKRKHELFDEVFLTIYYFKFLRFMVADLKIVKEVLKNRIRTGNLKWRSIDRLKWLKQSKIIKKIRKQIKIINKNLDILNERIERYLKPRPKPRYLSLSDFDIDLKIEELRKIEKLRKFNDTICTIIGTVALISMFSFNEPELAVLNGPIYQPPIPIAVDRVVKSVKPTVGSTPSLTSYLEKALTNSSLKAALKDTYLHEALQDKNIKELLKEEKTEKRSVIDAFQSEIEKPSIFQRGKEKLRNQQAKRQGQFKSMSTLIQENEEDRNVYKRMYYRFEDGEISVRVMNQTGVTINNTHYPTWIDYKFGPGNEGVIVQIMN